MAALTMDKLVALCKGRGFIYPGSEIYGGLANSWDYGPLGVEFKNNVKKAWWQKFVQESKYNVGLDAAILMNREVWVASGHVGGFNDPLMDCKACKARFRADKLIEDFTEGAETGDGWSNAELEKMLAQHELDMEELNADYEVTRISHEITRMQLESAAHESDIKRREIKLNLDKADISLARAKEQIENRRKIQVEEVKQKRLSIRQDEERLEEAYSTLDKLFVIAPSPGIAIISRNWSTDNKFQLGDQCWSSQQLIQLPDLSTLKAKVSINEVDISQVTKGLKVQIRPDAFSDSTFTGYVATVANLAQNKDNRSNIKVFPVEIVINEYNKNLLPGLTVSCRIIVDEIPDVKYVPLEALHVEGDKSYVFKKSVGGYDKVEVRTGQSNSDYVIIESGLGKHDRVALIDPTTLAKKEEKK